MWVTGNLVKSLLITKDAPKQNTDVCFYQVRHQVRLIPEDKPLLWFCGVRCRAKRLQLFVNGKVLGGYRPPAADLAVAKPKKNRAQRGCTRTVLVLCFCHLGRYTDPTKP